MWVLFAVVDHAPKNISVLRLAVISWLMVTDWVRSTWCSEADQTTGVCALLKALTLFNSHCQRGGWHWGSLSLDLRRISHENTTSWKKDQHKVTTLTELAHLCLWIKWRMHMNLYRVRISVWLDQMLRLGGFFRGWWLAFNYSFSSLIP